MDIVILIILLAVVVFILFAFGKNVFRLGRKLLLDLLHCVSWQVLAELPTGALSLLVLEQGFVEDLGEHLALRGGRSLGQFVLFWAGDENASCELAGGGQTGWHAGEVYVFLLVGSQ